MRLARVIPCLDVDAGRVVKGTNFVDLDDAGDPVELAAWTILTSQVLNLDETLTK